ncbi:MAG: hypothetical protein MI739_12990, partial [Bacteroidales bacterium]|nr:hypothetical protein [Bacteroidales bacterium]
MKKLLTLFTITIVTLNTFGQSNIFPPEGNVRIGTKYDGSILNILKKPVDGEAHLLLGDSVAQSGVVSSRLCFAGNKIQHAGLAWVPNSDNSKRDGKLHLAFGNYQNPMKNSIKVTFRSNGNLGIGVISPSSKLSIYGSNSEGWNSGIELNREGGGRGLIVVDSDGMKFKTPVDGDGFYFRDNENKTSLVIKDGGQVGIGTTVIGSSYKLAVQGKIGAH